MIRMTSDHYVIYRNIVGNKRKGATFATYTRARIKPSGSVLVLYSRVNLPNTVPSLDLPELTSIQLGEDAFVFSDKDSTELIMRSDDTKTK